MIIKNKKASHEYTLETEYIAGIVLLGTEIKSIRLGKASLIDSHCAFTGNELFLLNTHIAQYEFGNRLNHEPKRPRKLLLKKAELKKIRKKITEKGFTLIPKNMFINDKGLCKVTICIAKGKKLYDKKSDLKERDIKRDTDRDLEKYR
jgi:SsrA-binding protein